MRTHFERLATWYARQQFIPFYIEDKIFNVHLSKEVRSKEKHIVDQFPAVGYRVWQSSALVSPTETLNTDLNVEPLGVPCEDVEMNDEDEEPLEAAVRRA